MSREKNLSEKQALMERMRALQQVTEKPGYSDSVIVAFFKAQGANRF